MFSKCPSRVEGILIAHRIDIIILRMLSSHLEYVDEPAGEYDYEGKGQTQPHHLNGSVSFVSA